MFSFLSRNHRLLSRYRCWVDLINIKEEGLQNFSQSNLQSETRSLSERIRGLDRFDKDALIDACSLVKTACRRLAGQKWNVCGIEYEWHMIPFDVQVMGGLALIEGKIAQMATGEGKTLAAAFALFYHALSGKGAHLATANDFLALRDCQWMGGVFEYLGLKVGCIQAQMPFEERKKPTRLILPTEAGKSLDLII